MTVLWTTEDLLAATGGFPRGPLPSHVAGVSIDTRTVAAGDLFVGLRGVNRDGGIFAPDAMGKGAALALVARAVANDLDPALPLIIVDDTLTALEALAHAARRRGSPRRVAITGSVGKTSTKEAMRHALAEQGATHASVASYNNHWGVPLTLARMPAATRYGVFEIGMNHAFEILPLTAMVRPHVAVVTAVEAVHIANFRGIEGIADAKSEIMAGLEPGGVAILPRDNPLFPRLLAHAGASPAGRVVTFGSHPGADVRLLDAALQPDLSTFEASFHGRRLAVRLGLPGRHMVMNALAVLAAVEALGADVCLAALALQSVSPGAGRGQRVTLRLPNGSATLLDESYNANPASVRAALDLLAQTPTGLRGQRIAVLGDMLELGAEGPAMHRALAEAILAAGVDRVHLAGALMRNLWDALPPRLRGAYAETSAGLTESLLESVRPDDAIMVKGSLGSRMGPLVAALKARFPVEDPAAPGET